MSEERSTQTSRNRSTASRPSVANLQQENAVLRQRLLAVQAELDESNELEKFLRGRLCDLNATIRVHRARIADFEKDSSEAEVGQPPPAADA